MLMNTAAEKLLWRASMCHDPTWFKSLILSLENVAYEMTQPVSIIFLIHLTCILCSTSSVILLKLQS